MNCDEAKLLLVDFLYDEIENKDRLQFEAHLSECDSCRQEVAALQSNSRILQKWDVETPRLNMLFLQEKKSIWHSFRERISTVLPAKTAWGPRIAWGLGAAVVLLSLVNLNIESKNGDFALSMSLFPKPATLASGSADSPAIQLTRGEQITLMETMLQQSETRHRAEMTATLSSYAERLEQQRLADLQLIGTSIEQFQQRTDHH
ncbi:zf-HC2 domain-containing protein, partial [bacterium]|nr:zf-HC2 domain-containing protein [bacterium]